MERISHSSPQAFHNEEHYLESFRDMQNPTNRLALHALFDFAQRHLAEPGRSGQPASMDIYLIAMLMEEHKQLMSLREEIQTLKAKIQSMQYPYRPVDG